MKITREEFKQLVNLHKQTYELWEDVGRYISDDCFDTIAYPVYVWLEKNLGLEDTLGNSLLWESHDEDLDMVYDEWLGNEVKDESK